MACPPIHDWMPNHPHATRARKTAGTFAPRTPNEDRTRTGNGIPYLVPACEFKIIGISTIRLPNKIVPMACCQLMPPAIKPEASMYVGMQTLMATHNEA